VTMILQIVHFGFFYCHFLFLSLHRLKSTTLIERKQMCYGIILTWALNYPFLSDWLPYFASGTGVRLCCTKTALISLLFSLADCDEIKYVFDVRRFPTCIITSKKLL
jgi:hypothetical protein